MQIYKHFTTFMHNYPDEYRQEEQLLAGGQRQGQGLGVINCSSSTNGPLVSLYISVSRIRTLVLSHYQL